MFKDLEFQTVYNSRKYPYLPHGREFFYKCETPCPPVGGVWIFFGIVQCGIVINNNTLNEMSNCKFLPSSYVNTANSQYCPVIKI